MKGLESRRRLSDLSPFETYLVCVPAIMLGSILLLGGIILLLEPRKKTDAETLAEIRKALERPGDEFTNGNRPGGQPWLTFFATNARRHSSR